MTPDQWANFLRTVASIIAGSVPGVFVVLLFVLRLTRRMDLFLVEHEILMREYAKSRGEDIEDLPTRSKIILR